MSQSIAKSTLAICSSSDPAWLQDSHNPADFVVDMTNTMKMNRIARVAPSQVVIPRFFPNISEYNNTLHFYGRRVVEVPTGLPPPKDWLRTVNKTWEVMYSLIIPDGIYNIDQILLKINSMLNALGQTWTFDTDKLTVQIHKNAPGMPASPFGYFTPAPADPIDSWLPLVYMTGGGTELLSTLGIEKAAFGESIGHTDPVVFDPVDPDTFDSTMGTPLNDIPLFALFARDLHSFATWMTVAFDSPPLNSPNLAGPEFVYVLISELGDSSTVNATTGILYDVIKAMDITSVPFGERVCATIVDLEAESVTFKPVKSVNGFRVQVVDSKFRQLKLPRNREVNIILAVWYQHD